MNDINTQLDEIAKLEDGWFDGDGIAYDNQFLEKAKCIFNNLLNFININSVPHLYPTIEGNIRAEWEVYNDINVFTTLNAAGTFLHLFVASPDRCFRIVYGTDLANLKDLADFIEKLFVQ